MAKRVVKKKANSPTVAMGRLSAKSIGVATKGGGVVECKDDLTAIDVLRDKAERFAEVLLLRIANTFESLPSGYFVRQLTGAVANHGLDPADLANQIPCCELKLGGLDEADVLAWLGGDQLPQSDADRRLILSTAAELVVKIQSERLGIG